MAASALLQFTQGTNVGPDGEALIVNTSAPVVISNSDNANVGSYLLELCYAPPGSIYAFTPGTTAPTILAQGNGVLSYSFQPDVGVEGCYRFRLTTWTEAGYAGGSDVDVRCIGVPFPNGLIAPPYQKFPDPLSLPSLTAPGKPNETNFGGQPYGWQGGASDGLLYQALQSIGASGGGTELNPWDAVTTSCPLMIRLIQPLAVQLFRGETSVSTPHTDTGRSLVN
jgi:hypothetical protein